MQNLTKQNVLPFDLAHFQVEELEQRLENKWGCNEPTVEITENPDGTFTRTETLEPCSH